MDSSSLTLRVFLIMALLGIVRSSKTGCQCPLIPEQPLTDRPIKGCYNVNDTFRYKCSDGHVRRAGTSNMIRCNGNLTWTKFLLECIRDPRLPPQPTTISPSTAKLTEPQSVHPTTSVSPETNMNTTVLPTQPTPVSFTEPPRVNLTTSLSPETNDTKMNTTVLPTQPTAVSFTESPRVNLTTSLSPETNHTKMNTTVLPTQPTAVNPSSAKPLPQTSTRPTDTPRTTSNTTFLTPVTLNSFNSTPNVHTKGPRRFNPIMSTSQATTVVTGTYSPLNGTKAGDTNVILGVLVLGVIVLFAVGVGYFFYKRRLRNNILKGTPEETVAMKTTSST